MRPMIEIGNMRVELTMLGWKKRLVASPRRKIVMIQILDKDTTEPIISALWYPNECLESLFLCAMFKLTIESANPIKSLAK